DPAGAPGYAASGVGFTHPTFYQSAIFQAQSTRHLTFLVELANRWPELTHAENYDVTLVDDKGHVFRPAGSHGTSAHALFSSMNLGRTDVVHMVVTTQTGTHTYTHGEESTNDMKTMMGARTILEFQGPDPILTPETHQLKLSLKHKSRRIEFIW